MNHISVQELKERINNGEVLHIVDCREELEFEENNMGATIPLPLSQLNMMDATPIEHLEDEEIIVHCRSGQRSMQACMILEQMGFKNTTNVDGGFLAWIEAFGDEKI